jgi:glycosyltransferase EpsF
LIQVPDKGVFGMTGKQEYRVLQVFSALGMGGAETWLMALLRQLDKVKESLPFRLQIDICLTSGSKGVFDEEAKSLGAKLFYTTYSRKNLLSFLREFRAILADGHYHAIHDHQDYTAGIHFLIGVGQLPSVRVAHVHNPYIHIKNYSSGYARRLTISIGKSLLSRQATHIIGTSRQILSEYGFDNASFKKVKLSAVHCGFDVDLFMGDYKKLHTEICDEFGWENKSKIILFVGRLNGSLNHKNPRFALEVAKICIEKDLSIRLLMVGDGEDARVGFEREVKSWGLQDSIRFVGLRSDVPRLMAGSDLLLFPSVGEGLGMVAVEAQAAGLRVLASAAVPKECEVIPGTIEFKSLDQDSFAWAKESLKLLSLSRPDQIMCNQLVRNSPFSIDNSAASLLDIYFPAK